MTKDELIADLKSQDQSIDDWEEIWFNEKHKDEPLLTPYIRGYIDGATSRMNDQDMDNRSEDWMWELTKMLGYLISN